MANNSVGTKMGAVAEKNARIVAKGAFMRAKNAVAESLEEKRDLGPGMDYSSC